MTAPLVLASASPRRLALLQQIGRPPAEVIATAIDESALMGELPRDLAARLAAAKAAAGAALRPTAIILAADTVVACGRRILPRAETERDVRDCLRLLSGRRHRVYGGVVVRAPDGRTWRRVVMTVVKFKRLSDAEIAAYVAGGEWHGKAGGYAIQGRAGAFVSEIRGSYTNVVGLCVHAAENLLVAAQR